MEVEYNRSEALLANILPATVAEQLKDPAQLDGWLRDGSAHWVNALCTW
jgi:hypothetical protein